MAKKKTTDSEPMKDDKNLLEMVMELQKHMAATLEAFQMRMDAQDQLMAALSKRLDTLF